MSNSVKKPKSAKNGQPRRIVVIGANFAGLTSAINLSPDFSVNVIDCQPQFEFLPNIHELKTLTHRKHRVSVVIVGGGLEGVEALGEILRQYRRHPGLEIHLIENRFLSKKKDDYQSILKI